MVARRGACVRSRLVTRTAHDTSPEGLSLAPFRGLRPQADAARLGRLLCPPYDVIDEATRARLLAADPDNAVAVVLPDQSPEGYAQAAARLRDWIDAGLYAVDAEPALYVYELRDQEGHATRGLMGALELRAAEDGVILPHENTMAGPVADRLAVMTATDADLEPIYLLYDGGGPASELVRNIESRPPIAEATTSDEISHRLWSVSDAETVSAVASDLATRTALIADGHHRYATYEERQRQRHATEGAGPWDRGLALIVDSSEYGPQVHAIHRVVRGLELGAAVAALDEWCSVALVDGAPSDGLDSIGDRPGFAAVITDGRRSYVIADTHARLAAAAARPGEPTAVAGLDVTVLHRALVERVWQRPDDEQSVRYAHSVGEAVSDAETGGGIAVLLRPTPVAAVSAVAAAGARMPRKSTLFTPKPASGLVMRRLRD